MEQFQENCKRLMITRMTLENFKSYAGVQNIGPFHKRFSSIVGPNGSGKSNVIDAMLFVFGRKAKQLRLNKVSELIHKSSNYPNLEFARVSVDFQLIYDNVGSDDTFEVIPDSEFTITRIAYVNNTSKYLIDAKSATVGEVCSLLKHHGVDLDNNRFLILQGEVEQISLMKPKAVTPHEDGLLEYLEDIIGSNRFVERINESFKVLEEKNEKRTERIARVKFAEKDRNKLSGSRDIAEAFIEIEKNIRLKLNELDQINEYREIQRQVMIQDNIKTVANELTNKQLELKEKETEYLNIQREKNEALNRYKLIEEELQKANADFGAFERRDVKLQEDKKHCKEKLKKCQGSIVKENKKKSECEIDVAKVSDQVEQMQKSLDDIKTRKETEEAAAMEIRASLEDATKDLRASLEEAQTELAENERAIASLKTKQDGIMTSQNLVKERSLHVESTISACQEKLLGLQSKFQSLQQQYGEEQKSFDALKYDLDAMNTEIISMINDEAAMKDKISSMLSSLEETKALYSHQQSQSSRNGVVARLLNASKPGGPLQSIGIRGRLGDLGSIAPEYDIAVSTACGQLDFVVVNTAEDGQACINYLKEGNYGRATFIVLNQLDSWVAKMNRPIQVPQKSKRLFDLVQPKSQDILPAFYMALRDTLVANNLDEAVAIAYVGDRAQWKVVTLDGGLIDTSGTMSGGGTSVRRGGMILSSGVSVGNAAELNNQIRQDDIDILVQEVDNLKNGLQSIRNSKLTLENKKHDAEIQLKSLTLQMKKSESSMKHTDEQIDEIMKRIQKLQEEVPLTAEEMNEINVFQAQWNVVEDEIHLAAPKLGPLKNTISTLQRRILDVGGPKLARIQAKIEILSKQYDAQFDQLNTKQNELANLNKMISKTVTSLEKLQTEEFSLQTKFDQLNQEQEEMENEAQNVIENRQRAEIMIAQEESLLKETTENFRQLDHIMSQLRAKEIDLIDEHDQLKKALQKSQESLKLIQMNLKSLRQLHLDEQHDFEMAIHDVVNSTTEVVLTEDYYREATDELPILQSELLSGYTDADIHELKQALNEKENERDKLKKDVNMTALYEYFKKDLICRQRTKDLEQITIERDLIRVEYETLRRQRLDEFMKGFDVISLKLKEMYQMITLGGDAELELVDSLDPFSEGIVFSVRPPKKSWKHISNLSGGEKTLSSLALVFALHHYKPTPLYVMDEIDAALDFKNVSIVANYIKERTKDAQFVIISLRNNMFELANRLVGIYKTHDATKSVTINPHAFVNIVTINSTVAHTQSSGIETNALKTLVMNQINSFKTKNSSSSSELRLSQESFATPHKRNSVLTDLHGKKTSAEDFIETPLTDVTKLSGINLE